MSSCLHTVLSEDKEFVVLCMIAYSEFEYRFLYHGNSWRLEIHKSEVRGLLSLNHDVRSLEHEFTIRPYIKLRKTDDGLWESRVLYNKGDEVIKSYGHNAKAETALDCTALTLRNIYGD